MVGKVQGWLLVVKRQKAYPLEESMIQLLPLHHGPGRSPLDQKHLLDELGYGVDEGDGACGLVQHFHFQNCLIRHENISRSLKHSVGHVLKTSQIRALVDFMMYVAHVISFCKNPTHLIRRHGILAGVNELGPVGGLGIATLAVVVGGLPDGVPAGRSLVVREHGLMSYNRSGLRSQWWSLSQCTS